MAGCCSWNKTIILILGWDLLEESKKERSGLNIISKLGVVSCLRRWWCKRRSRDYGLSAAAGCVLVVACFVDGWERWEGQELSNFISRQLRRPLCIAPLGQWKWKSECDKMHAGGGLPGGGGGGGSDLMQVKLYSTHKNASYFSMESIF